MSRRAKELLERINSETILGDGAMGTLFNDEGIEPGVTFEQLNLLQPERVRKVHEAYLAAGSELIETNTFGANASRFTGKCDRQTLREINQAGVKIARVAAGSRAFVVGAIGPIHHVPAQDPDQSSTQDVRSIYEDQILALANEPIDGFLFETFSDLQMLQTAIEVAKAKTDLPIIAQMAFQPHGHTASGVSIEQAVQKLHELQVDVIGSNCGRGARGVAHATEEILKLTSKPVSAFINAGLPQFLDGRFFFGAPIHYLVEISRELIEKGVQLIGGCCGTTPGFIRQLAESLRTNPVKKATRVTSIETDVTLAKPSYTESLDVRFDDPIRDLIQATQESREPIRKPLVVVELDPPKGLNYRPLIQKARLLRDMGVDAITMADNPVATLHMGNLSVADIVQQEAGVPVILHLACRDSNLLGLQSRLLEAHIKNIRFILALTGDPARVGDEPNATSVYDLNSFGLVELIGKFNQGVSNAGLPLGGKTDFSIGVAFNPNGRNLRPLVDRLRRKREQGAHYALTQPIYDIQRFHEVVEATKDITLPIFYGLMPLLSEKNAEYLHNEVPGIVLTDEARARMKGLSGKEGRKVGNRICMDLMDAMIPSAKAFYLIPPHKFPEMAVELVDFLNQKCPSRLA
jgi:methionine synthase / methylenetetrahydrofolate reductase(NADPH)